MIALRGRTLGRYAWALTYFGVAVAAATLTRCVVFFLSDHAPVGPASVASTFLAGGVYDVLVAAWLSLPVLAYLTFVSRRRYNSRPQQFLRRVFLGIFVAATVFVVAAEIAFFAEFDGRFNFVAVDYLIYPTEVVVNIWQSYPMVWILLGIFAVSVALVWRMSRLLAAADGSDHLAFAKRCLIAGAYAGAVGAATFVITPRLAHVSDDRVLNEVASNGYYTFWQALLGRDAPYVGWYASRPPDTVRDRLHDLLSHPVTGDTTRLARNVVIVLEESFGSTFVGALHPRDSLPITPSFDSLAGEGVLLTRAYSTGNRTIRAIEATTTSLPPLPGVSIVRRAQSSDLFTLPAVLRATGYRTEFIYGGRALFDGMGTYVRHNGFDRVVEQKDYPPGSFKTAWGVADEVIFDRALVELDSLHAKGAPFFCTILTVSNHKPYAYPANRVPNDPRIRKRNAAVRYADWSLGRFMRAARSHAFFDNTLFVLMGDHGARVYGSAEIPLPSYEVPILFYMPSRLKPARISTLASSIDVPPTVLGLLGMHDPTKFFGRDVLAHDATAGRALMTHNSELALMRGDRIAVLGLHGVTTVNHVDSSGAFHRIAAPDSADRALIEDAIAYFQGADMLYRSGAYRMGPLAHVPDTRSVELHHPAVSGR